jgi:hypothetical protein
MGTILPDMVPAQETLSVLEARTGQENLKTGNWGYNRAVSKGERATPKQHGFDNT